MAWFPTSLLIKRRSTSTCTTKMRVLFFYARRRYVTMADMRHALAHSNTNNFVVNGQKYKVWVLVFLEQEEHFENKIEQIRRNFLFCNKTASSTHSPFKRHCSLSSSNGLGNKTVFMPVCSIVKLFRLGAVDDLMHYYMRPRAKVHQVVHSTEALVLTILQAGMK